MGGTTCHATAARDSTRAITTAYENRREQVGVWVVHIEGRKASSFPAHFVGGATGSLDNFGNGYTSPFNIYFATAVNGAAFQYVSNTGTTLFEAYLAGNLVGSYSAVTSTAQIGGTTPEFYGFDNLMLDRLQVYTEQGVNGAMALDNLEAGSVVATPEPASVILVATGLFAVVGTARLRRKNSLS